MLFAAGFGTRMGPLTATRPKPMIPVGGRPLIDHTLELAKQVEPRVIVANLHYLPEVLERHLAPKDVRLSREHPDILDTGGGLLAALPLLGAEPVYTANTDAIWQGPNPFELLRTAWEPDRMDAFLLCVEPASAVGHQGQGDFLLGQDGRLRRGPGVIYGGIQIIRTDSLRDIPERSFSLNLLWNRMETEGRLFGLTYPGRWCDVGRPDGIRLAETLLEAPDV
ncbi:MobA-like NTP transferase domain-containing protein [Salinihabitans flavidus]|uniref:MobA-like NTP transferase domain-containing protein n=2 Tax=Salinihabitans flavidus TaxID=569882 RepID=A0A1H8M0U9_9RHOB|nr:MobA-like NTP transferase domain-containing protein [Salinihabitans flavidus]